METIQKEITEKEIILAASGMDSFGRPKAMVSFYLEEDTGENKIFVNELHVIKPELNVFKNPIYTQVDLKFKSSIDKDLTSQWEFLQNYCKAENSEENGKNFKELSICIFPKEFNMKYYMMGANPIMFALTPLKPASDEVILRIVFDNYNFVYLETNQEELQKCLYNYENGLNIR